MGDPVIAAIITSVLTSIITIIGFIVTDKINKRTSKEDLNNKKQTLNIEKLQKIIIDLCWLLENASKTSISTEKYKSLMYNILSYGSTDAIKIITNLQTTLYKNEKNQVTENDSIIFILTSYSLLVTQIKYDLTGEIIPPLSYAKLKFKAFDDISNNLYIKNNELVDKLCLNESFKSIL